MSDSDVGDARSCAFGNLSLLYVADDRSNAGNLGFLNVWDAMS